MTPDAVQDTVGEDSHDDEVHEEYHQDLSFQPRANRIGLWAFILSEVFLFGAFLSARYFSVGTLKPEELNQTLALILTIVLLLSSISAYLAETSIRYNHRRNFIIFTAITIFMGLVFIDRKSVV